MILEDNQEFLKKLSEQLPTGVGVYNPINSNQSVNPTATLQKGESSDVANKDKIQGYWMKLLNNPTDKQTQKTVDVRE